MPNGYKVKTRRGVQIWTPRLSLSQRLRKFRADVHWKRKQKLAGDGRRFYGDGGTIHSTTALDVETKDGTVVAVWFRCQSLPFKQTEVSKTRAVEMGSMYEQYNPSLSGVEVSR